MNYTQGVNERKGENYRVSFSLSFMRNHVCCQAPAAVVLTSALWKDSDYRRRLLTSSTIYVLLYPLLGRDGNEHHPSGSSDRLL